MSRQFDYYSHMDEMTKLADDFDEEQQWRREVMQAEKEATMKVLPPMKQSKLIPNGKLKLPRIAKRHKTKGSLPF